jgi:hypothetical protein
VAASSVAAVNGRVHVGSFAPVASPDIDGCVESFLVAAAYGSSFSAPAHVAAGFPLSTAAASFLPGAFADRLSTAQLLFYALAAGLEEITPSTSFSAHGLAGVHTVAASSVPAVTDSVPVDFFAPVGFPEIDGFAAAHSAVAILAAQENAVKAFVTEASGASVKFLPEASSLEVGSQFSAPAPVSSFSPPSTTAASFLPGAFADRLCTAQTCFEVGVGPPVDRSPFDEGSIVVFGTSRHDLVHVVAARRKTTMFVANF